MNTNHPVNNHDELLKVVDGLLGGAGLDRKDLGGKVTFAGMDPIRPTRLKVGCASAAITGANAIASALIWKMRTGEGQDIHIDLRKAYVTQSAWQDTLANCTLINGTPHMVGGAMGGHGNQILPCKDGRFVMLTSLYPASEDRVMKLLDEVARQRHPS
jgi:crotonobetainyl-CoA:carnitine CoA-transferase CaiB-like acyl-CoA transferase